MKKLKVLKSDLTSPFQKFKYEIGKEYICHNFDNNPDNGCSSGFYATDIEGLPYSYNIKRKVFEVDVSGDAVIIDQYKQRFERQTIIREVAVPELISLAKKEEKRIGYKLSEVLSPIIPLQGSIKEVTCKEIELLNQWASVWASVGASVRALVRASVGTSVWASVGASVGASVRDSVRASVWASVGASVRDSVRDSVRASVGDSVWASVRDSVRDSVWAYISSIFFNIDYKEGANPLQPGIDLWKRGFIASLDGETWRLLSGEKITIVYKEN